MERIRYLLVRVRLTREGGGPVQLHIVNRDHKQYTAGDILGVLPDIHIWSPLEVASRWLSHNNLPGLPDEYRDDLDDPPGTFPRRTVANFPNPWSAVVRYPSYRCDLNLAEPWLEIDLTELGATRQRQPRLWFLDLNALPTGQRNSLEQPGGEATLGANRLGAIMSKHDVMPITNVVGWDTTGDGDNPHRHPGTMCRDRLGVLPGALGRPARPGRR